MTAAAAAVPGLRLPLAFTIAMRELRSGAGGLIVFVLCIALGVAAVAAIGSLAASFNAALAQQGRLLIGGDLSYELIHREANQEERAALEAFGQISESAGFRAMARSAEGKTALVEVKAVDDAYPLYGEVAVLEPEDAGPAWRFPGIVLAERALLDRLGIDLGGKLAIGETTVTVGGILGQQPDRLADRLSYGPKLLMSRETLDRYGAVSRQTAEEMVRGVLGHSRVHLVVSVTGIAGPDGGSPEKPVGLVHFAAGSVSGRLDHAEKRFGDIGRSQVRKLSVLQAFRMLHDLAEAEPSRPSRQSI